MAVTAAPDARAHHGCGSPKPLVQTREAVVFAKRQGVYACRFATGSVFRLDGPGNRVQTRPTVFGKLSAPDPPLALAGAFAGYVANAHKVVIRRLTDGKVVAAERSALPVATLVLRRDGAAAWTTPDPVDGSHELRTLAGLVDKGPDLDYYSLALSADRTRIFWVRGGKAQTAGL
jgi:hypothetical protein